MANEKTPGLKWRKRQDGGLTPIWCAPQAAIKAGFTIKTWNISECPPEELAARCQRIWAEAMDFLGTRRAPLAYDGTISSLLRLYELHPESSIHRLKPSSRHPYDIYLAKLAQAYGARRVANLTGLDIMRWHEAWRAPAQNGKPRLAAATMVLTVLKSALSFGQVCGLDDCARLRETLRALRLPHPRPRQEAPDAQDVRRAIDAAIAMGRPSAALAYALQFETCLRQYDVLALKWSDIDANMIMTLTPGKTADTTGRRVVVDLKLCPMIMELLQAYPRTGLYLVIDERTGRPYEKAAFTRLWATVREKAGLPRSVWNRDLRAGAITEGGMAGVSADDRAKLAGHSPKMTRKVYDRDTLISATRVAEARARFRVKGSDAKT